ncbi:MAG: pantoate--beta-alanine ligase [Bacteroidia bacterium]
MTKIIHSIAELRAVRKSWGFEKKLGFVPTMGALHAGHGSLVARSVAENDYTIVSVFVNPTQFGPKEDLAKYPRTLEKDVELVQGFGADVVFAPSPADIYPVQPAQIRFGLLDMDKKLCGKSRPGHFDGVIQVVSLLFHLVQPDNAYFGQKDFQQLMIIQQLAKEQHFPVNIIGGETIRENDGLAMSSRNIYLSAEERKNAVALSQILFYLRDNVALFQGIEEMKNYVNQELNKISGLRLDYFEILEENALAEIENWEASAQPHAFIAAFFGNTRLIDNIRLR